MTTRVTKLAELVDKYPELFCRPFEAPKPGYLGVGEGWVHILDALFSSITRAYRQEQDRYLAMRKAEGGPLYKGGPIVDAISVEKARINMSNARQALPQLAQVKEKFGGLRVYVDSATEETYAFIDMAEAMSYRTCEVCGKPGHPREGGWIQTLCDEHAKKK